VAHAEQAVAQMVDSYIRHLSLERQFGKTTDDKVSKQRETALSSLQSVIADYRRRFQSFSLTSDELYGAEIRKVLQNIAVVWSKHRNCYIDLTKIDKEATG